LALAYEKIQPLLYTEEEMEVVGSGLVIIADGTSNSYINLADCKNGDPLTVEGIRTHVLGPGMRFLISERRLKLPD
jgi:cyanophycinase-like exopeptidase